LAAKAKVQRLLDANVIREVKYSEWQANVVLVQKKNDKMRLCIDFTDLNKACKKDPFPLPRIDASIDKTAGCKRFSLLDCFSGYHQIWLKKEDRKNKLHHSFWNLLLHKNAGGSKKCRCHLCQNDSCCPRPSALVKHCICQ
jgi:hypothetical protein